MNLSKRREFISPEPDDDWAAIVARVLPDESPETAMSQLKSWNLHLFARQPPGEFMGSDVIFVEPPLDGEEAPSFFGVEIEAS
jgi:hypothetical protein